MRCGRFQLAGFAPICSGGGGGGGGEIPVPPERPPEPPVLENDETVFDVEFVDYEIRDSYCQLQIQVGKRQGFDRVTIDWGDGTVNEWTDYLAWHNYTAVGRYTIRIGREARWFRVWSCYTVTKQGQPLTSRPQMWLDHWGDWIESAEGTFCGWSDPNHGGLKGTLPPWGRSITSTYCCFEYCTDLTGRFPEWTDAITDACGTYQHCKLSGPLPKWGKNIERCGFTYYKCETVEGRFLPWPEKCVETNSCYYGCTRLAGEVPPWPDCAVDIGYTYKDCPGLAGVIPPWPEAAHDLSGCYWNCTGLTGVWTDDPELLMPEAKLQDGWMNRSYDVVTGCADAIRALFWDKNWGGSIPRPIPLPEG